MAETTPTWTLETTIDGPAADCNHTQLPAARPPAVLVLGHSLGSDLTMWDGVVERLKQHAVIVRYNLPGHGGSPEAPVEGPLRMKDITEALYRTLDDLRIDEFHFAGLSFGGLTGLALGIDGNPRLKSLSILSSGPVNAPLEQWPEKIATVREQGTEALVDATFERWFSEDASTKGPEISAAIEKVRYAFVGCSDEGYAQICEVLGSTDLSDEVSRISVPTRLISAEKDGALPWDKADELAEQIRENGTEVSVVHLPDLKHMSATEDPDSVARSLGIFLGLGDAI